MSKDTSKKEKKEQKNNFMKELRTELKKVTWPSRKDLVTNTVTVIMITLIISAIVFVLDFSFEKLYTFGVGNLKNAVVASKSVEENAENPETNTATENTADTNTNVEAQPVTNESTPNETQVTENTANTTAE